MANVDWIAVDWGTAHMRVWGMSNDGTIQFRRESDDGMGVLTHDAYEPALLAQIDESLSDKTPVIVCGMAGSRQGWAEAKYATAPCCPPTIQTATQVQTCDPRLSVHILPGIKQDNPADVMRGEETQIAGFLALNPKFDGVICLPGTHTKWAHISAGEIVSFRTFLTGELFSLLSNQSVLQHSVAKSGWDSNAFSEAVETAMSRPSEVAARFFSLRAESLLDDLDPSVARSRLSGLLVGVELAAAKPYWLGQHVALIGNESLCKAYSDALNAQGLPVERTNVERLTLEGLKAAYAGLMEKRHE